MSTRLGAAMMIGVGLLVALAATIGPLPPASGQPGASLAVSVPGGVKMVVVALFSLSALILVALQRRPRPSGDEPVPVRARRPLSAWLVALLPLPLLLALIVLWRRRSGSEANPIETALSAIADLMDFFAHARKPPTSLPFFDVTVSVLMVVVAVAVAAFMAAIALADRVQTWRARGPAVVPAASRSPAPAAEPGDPRAEPDPRLAIIRAWRRFEHALAATRAARAPWQTPAEFMRTALARLPLPVPAVLRLTALFEVARFSRSPLAADTRDAACDYLDEIQAALAEDSTRGR